MRLEEHLPLASFFLRDAEFRHLDSRGLSE